MPGREDRETTTTTHGVQSEANIINDPTPSNVSIDTDGLLVPGSPNPLPAGDTVPPTVVDVPVPDAPDPPDTVVPCDAMLPVLPNPTASWARDAASGIGLASSAAAAAAASPGGPVRSGSVVGKVPGAEACPGPAAGAAAGGPRQANDA
ncbi:hypothetical protein HDU96_004199 [Phlyctochytrium bullatum]|nr:hypothetical protein HDU96_004199 [Phlyctochytrium bullatum]